MCGSGSNFVYLPAQVEPIELRGRKDSKFGVRPLDSWCTFAAWRPLAAES